MSAFTLAAIRIVNVLTMLPRVSPLSSARSRIPVFSAHFCTVSGLLGAFLFLVPTVASADLYRWTDERGTTVLSNVLPPNPKRVTNFEVVVKEPAPTASKGASAQHEVTATEKLLLDRIDGLERQVQAQQSRERTIVAAPPADPYYGSAPASYAGGELYPGYPGYPGYYPSWVFPYPTSAFYTYPYPPSLIGFRPRGAFPQGGVVRGGRAVTIRTR